MTASRRTFLKASSAVVLAVAVRRPRADRPARTAIVYHPACAKHVTGQGHPEQPTRVDSVLRAMQSLEREQSVMMQQGRMAREEDILLVHTPAYLELVRKEIRSGRPQLSTGDTLLSPHSFEAAMAAVGCVLSGVDLVMGGQAANAFCPVRPPGHHASAEVGMGFCIFNNVAVGARYAQKRYGVQRVLIADWDVHHGNGTQDIFWRDGSVLFFDTHLHPWYPGTGAADEVGEGDAKGQIMNRPFAAGSGREIVAAYGNDLVAAAERFKPELILVSAGFDSRVDDPLGGLRLTDEDYAEMTDILIGVARKHAGGRIVSALEGGYNLDGIASAARSHVSRLAIG